MTQVPEPGSFRDPDSHVVYDGEDVLRRLSRRGLEDFAALQASGLLADPRLIPTTVVADGLLRHERVPFVSYPYEWCFSMLRSAALLQLDLLLAAVGHDLMIKDATPYNVQFLGARPVFIDIGSFERLREEELWVGYRQFCELYLFPLLLQAHHRVTFQPLLRGSLEGIPAAQMRLLVSMRDRFRRGYLTHVYLQARLGGRTPTAPHRSTSLTRRPGVGKAVIAANARKMRRLVERLSWEPPRGVWTAYGADNSYSPTDAEAKDAFVREVAATRHWPTVWDLGCNNGRHSRVVAPYAGVVVAMDADPASTELLHRSLRESGPANVLPLTVDLADPSPARGWRNRERGRLEDRGRPDLVLALALVHHLVIAANIPLAEVVDWLCSLGGRLVVELPHRDDPMVQTLLAPKRAGLHADYSREHFEALLSERTDVDRSLTLSGGTRTLYVATPREPRG